MSGFGVSGISSFNRKIFSGVEFIPSYVTDRLKPFASLLTYPGDELITNESSSNSDDDCDMVIIEEIILSESSHVSPSRENTQPNCRTILKLTLENIRPQPKVLLSRLSMISSLFTFFSEK